MNYQQEIEKSLESLKMAINNEDKDVEKLKSIFGMTDSVEEVFNNKKI